MTKPPIALPQTESVLFVPSTGPEIEGITPCGNNRPNTLFLVARLTWARESTRKVRRPREINAGSRGVHLLLRDGYGRIILQGAFDRLNNSQRCARRLLLRLHNRRCRQYQAEYQDHTTFAAFLRPLKALGWPMLAVRSDQQPGVMPAVATVLPESRSPFGQAHDLRPLAEPLAEPDAALKVALRKTGRQQVGP